MKKSILYVVMFSILNITTNAQQLELVEDYNLDGSNIYQFESDPSEFTEFNGKLYFSATGRKVGTELYSYDGTDVELIADINPKANSTNYYSSSPRNFKVFDNKLYFVATNENDSIYIYSYDGVNPPTTVINMNAYGYSEMFVFDDNLYYTAPDTSSTIIKLWEYDGTNEPTLLVSPTSTSTYGFNSFVEFNSKLYFCNKGSNAGLTTYYVYDGTNAPTAAPNTSNFLSFGEKSLVFGNKIIFSANLQNGPAGNELWEYDGVNTPVLLEDVNVGIQSSSAHSLTIFNNKLYFSAYSGTESELMSYDGTTVSQVVNLNAANSSYPTDLTVNNGKLYFIAYDDVEGTDLYEYDGTNTPIMKEFVAGDGGVVKNLISFQNKILFAGENGTVAEELYQYDGTSFSLVANIMTGTYGLSPSYLTEYKDKIYFNGFGSEGLELYSFDGVSIELTADIDTNHTTAGSASSSNPRFLMVFNDLLYFYVADGKMWKYDGVSAPTVDTNFVYNTYTNNFVEFNNKLYYKANDGTSGVELWEYDGTNPSVLVADISIGSSSSSPSNLSIFNNKLIFSANDGVNGQEMWQYDGTNPPSMIEVFAGTESSYPSSFSEYDGKLYFSAAGDTIAGQELWVYDGTNAPSLVADIYTGGSVSGTISYPNGSSPHFLNVLNDKLCFTAYDSHGKELWEYDGVNAPVRITDYNPTSSTWMFSSLTVVDSALYFWADEGAGLGYELYKYDGTGLPVMFDEVNVGGEDTKPQTPSNILKYNGNIYLGANDGYVGGTIWSELYKIAACDLDISITENNATLTANEIGASYQWIDCDNGNAEILGETNQSFTAIQTGNYACVINKSSCEEITDCVNVTISGIENLNIESKVTVYPNPSADLINIKTNVEIYTVNIYSVVGKKVQTETANQFSIKTLENGMYFIEIYTAEGIVSKPLIKK